MVKMSGFNPLLLPENLNKYGLGIWTASVDRDTQETNQERALDERHSKIFTIFCNCSRMTKFTFKKMEPLEKVVKNAQRALEIVTQLQNTATPLLINVSASFKNAVEFFESLRFIGSIKILLLPQKNNKYFLADRDNSIPKKCDRVLLAGHTSCKLMRSLNKWQLLDLGQIAKIKIGAHLTAFHLITDGMMIASSSFGLWDLSSQVKSLNEKRHKINAKLEKWENRYASMGLILTEDQAEIAKFQQRWTQKVLELEKELNIKREKLSSPKQELPKIVQQINQLEKKLHKNEKRLQKIAAKDFTSLVNELYAKNVKSKCDQLSKEKIDQNAKSRTLLIKTASSVAKIAVITMALVLTAINLWTKLPLIALLSLGIVADTLGLVKIFLDKGAKIL
jgi:hypothetical protein